MSKQITADQAYTEAYARVLKAIEAVEAMVHDLPAPEGEIKINWAHVGTMNHIATQLEQLAENE